MVPIPIPVAVPDNSMFGLLFARIALLEQASAQSLDKVHQLFEQLDGKPGGTILSAESKSAIAECMEDKVAAVVDEIDRLVKAGQQGPAARLLRQELDFTWDETHAGMKAWGYMPRDQKIGMLRISRLIKATAKLPG